MDKKTNIAILYSGGTDSTCAAAIMAKDFDTIHLLTFKRFGLFSIENSILNSNKLKNKFKTKLFLHKIIDVDKLARFVYYQGYFRNVFRYGFFSLSNCGLCALTNHIRTLIYCLDNGFKDVADGINSEWPFFPGHMEEIIGELKKMYSEFGIIYRTPVFDLVLPSEPVFLDKIKGSLNSINSNVVSSGNNGETTGRYLYRLGILPEENVKGTELDRRMQARCFQFILHNIFVHWYYMPNHSYHDYEKTTLLFFQDKIARVMKLLKDYQIKKDKSLLYRLVN